MHWNALGNCCIKSSPNYRKKIMPKQRIKISRHLVKANYCYSEIAWLCFCYLWTKISFPRCALIRFPLVIRGKKNIRFGKNFKCGYHNRFEVYTSSGRLEFGNNVQINDFCHISSLCSIIIGDNTLIASRVFITEHNHGLYSSQESADGEIMPIVSSPIDRDYETSPVNIGKNVWIGEGVTILPGVNVGDYCIIGANSVVTRDLPASTISIGIPAKTIRYLGST